MRLALLVLALPSAAAAAPPGPHDIAAYPLLWQTPEMARVEVRRRLPYPAGGGITRHLDLYLPLGRGPHPLVVLVNGAGDAPPREMRQMAAYQGWARLLAAQGMAAVLAESGLGNGLADSRALLLHLAAPGSGLGLDPARLAVWASSSDAPVAVAALSEPEPPLAGAVLLYGIGDAARARPEVPVLAVRAGRDTASWNAAADRMLAQAEERGLPWTVLRPAGLHHAFDLLDDDDESFAAVRAAVAFLRARLSVTAPPALGEARPPRAPGPDGEARRALALWRAREWREAEKAYAAWLGRHRRDPVARARMGVSLHMQGRHAEAATALETAVADGEAGPGVLYNLACARSRAGQLPGALKALEEAVAEGFDDAEGLARDPDLEPLRGSERYRALLARLRREPAPPAPEVRP